LNIQPLIAPNSKYIFQVIDPELQNKLDTRIQVSKYLKNQEVGGIQLGITSAPYVPANL
jgi:hypothetical protein